MPKVGFHNQHVTGSSRGYRGNHGRNAVEASHLGVELQDYEKQDNDLKPKYGWLIPKLDSGIQRLQVHYGTDIFVLDKQKLRKRTTWTAGDSLNPASNWIPSWTSGQTMTPLHWEHTFTPWSQRALLAPLIQGYEQTQFRPTVPTETAEVGEGAPLFKRAYGNSEYVELQFWGQLNLDQVKSFIFIENPPTGEFLAELLQRKIAIY